MSIHNKEIAERLRAIRELSDMEPEELAAAMGVPVDEYVSYESGEVDIPISVSFCELRSPDFEGLPRAPPPKYRWKLQGQVEEGSREMP